MEREASQIQKFIAENYKSEAESLHGLGHCEEQGYKWLYRYQNEAWYRTC